jgi:hypothetical protein
MTAPAHMLDDSSLDRLPSLEDASALPLCGARTDFYGFARQPIGEIPTNALTAIHRQLERARSTPTVQEQLAAIAVVLDARQRGVPVMMRTRATPAAPTEKPLDPNSLAGITRRIAELLERPELSPATKQQIRTRLHARTFTSIEQMRYELDRITATLDLPPTQAAAR